MLANWIGTDGYVDLDVPMSYEDVERVSTKENPVQYAPCTEQLQVLGRHRLIVTWNITMQCI